MARTFVDLGYAVDVIDFRNDRFEPEKDYAILVMSGTIWMLWPRS